MKAFNDRGDKTWLSSFGRVVAVISLMIGTGWFVLLITQPGDASDHKGYEDAERRASDERPRIVIREVIRETASPAAPPPVEEELLDEESAEMENEVALEELFQQSAQSDVVAVDTQNYLGGAFVAHGAQSHDVECRKSFCRIEANFSSRESMNGALQKIFLAEESFDKLPNLASTVSSRSVEEDGSSTVRIYLHPDQ